MNELNDDILQKYESKFNALADQKRLLILHTLCVNGRTCVCELSDTVGLPQSKLSYHLKVLLDAELIRKENEGTWSYYEVNRDEIGRILSDDLCCVFVPGGCC